MSGLLASMSFPDRRGKNIGVSPLARKKAQGFHYGLITVLFRESFTTSIFPGMFPRKNIGRRKISIRRVRSIIDRKCLAPGWGTKPECGFQRWDSVESDPQIAGDQSPRGDVRSLTEKWPLPTAIHHFRDRISTLLNSERGEGTDWSLHSVKGENGPE